MPHLDAPRSLHFEVVDKDVPDGFVLKIGRFTDKQTLPNRVTFKSKVVSRGHAEIYTELGKVTRHNYYRDYPIHRPPNLTPQHITKRTFFFFFVIQGGSLLSLS